MFVLNGGISVSISSMLLLASVTTSVLAQEHLEPEPGILAERDEYRTMVREVFADFYRTEPVLKVVILPSFRDEQVIGIQKTEQGYQAFAAVPSQRLWLTHLRLEQERRQTTSDKHLADLRERAPLDPAKITVKTERADLPAPMAERLAAVWKKSLLEVRHPKKQYGGSDGDTFHFSMFALGYGTLGGQIWTPAKDSKMEKLVKLVEALQQYTQQKAKLDVIEAALKDLE